METDFFETRGTKYPTAEFNNTMRLNPRWSSYTCFMEVLRKRKTMSRRIIRRAFEALVDPDDYRKEDKGEIINFVCWFAYDKKNWGVSKNKKGI